MALYRDEAVVLRTYKLGEADRIVVGYSRGRGKLRAVAKGVRRTRSKFGSRLEPGTIVQLQLYEGRNLDIVTQAERVGPMTTLRDDLTRYGRTNVVLEVVDAVTIEGESNPALYKMITGALTELDRTGNQMVVPAFIARLLTLEGVQPRLDSCVRCDDTEGLDTIRISEGGVVCRSCSSTGEAISPTARHALGQLLTGQVRRVLETTDPATARELETLMVKLIEQHVERSIRSSAVLHQQLLGH